MSKNNIAQQYNSMVASIEDAKIYDGRGEYNLYECNKCNNYKVTLYKDKGVTIHYVNMIKYMQLKFSLSHPTITIISMLTK